MTVGLRHVDRFVDRHGHARYYFRRPGEKRVPLPGTPTSPEFLAAYHEAMAASPAPVIRKRRRGAEGTFDRLCSEYLGSTGFLRTKASTRAKMRGLLDRFCLEHGHRLVRQFRRKHAEAVIAAKAETPAGANNLLKALRIVMAYAIKNEWREDDPTAKIARFREGTHHTWNEEELAAFEARWPVGSRERTAYALALFTGQRRADLAAMTWRSYDAKAGTIEVVQQKADMERTDDKMVIPVHRDLRIALEHWPQRNVMILATSFGKPFSVAGFGNMMADAIGGAGLPARCVLHGLRKAAARRLAEAGCSSKQIASITGHKSLEEVERYTAKAEQKMLARAAVTRLEEHRRET